MTYELSQANETAESRLDQELELIARKKCKICKRYMPKEILTPKCRKCYEDCQVTVSTNNSITLL